MTATVPRVPEGLRDLMKGFTKEVLREKPLNIYDFSLNYFEALLGKSDDYTVKHYEEPINYANIYRVRDCNRVPAAIVFKIIPETLTDLIKEFIKAVLRENPQNICEFGVDYFRGLKKTTSKNDDIQYTTYNNFIKNKEHLSLAPYAQCKCGRPFLSEVIQQQHLGRDIVDSRRETSAEKSCLTHDEALEKTPAENSINNTSNLRTESKSISNSKLDVNDEIYINAVYVIQRFFRNWIKSKQNKSKIASGQSCPENPKISEEAAAVIIQRSLRKLFAKKFQQNLKPYPVIPILMNIQQHEEVNDNVSETASYTSASTVRMSAESAAETMEMENSEYETIVSDEQTVSQTIVEVDEQQNDRVAVLELGKQTENSINSQKGRANDNNEVGDVNDLNWSTRGNQANKQAENVDSLTYIQDEPNENILHSGNIETIDTDIKQADLKMGPPIVKQNYNIEDGFIDPRLVSLNQPFLSEDSGQENLFINMVSSEIFESIGNNKTLSDQFNTNGEHIINDSDNVNTNDQHVLNDSHNDSGDTQNKLDDSHSGKCISIENQIEQSSNDEDTHNIKKRHTEDPNMASQDDNPEEQKCSEKFENEIDAIETVSSNAKEIENSSQNALSSEELKEMNSKNSAQLRTDSEFVEAHDSLAASDDPSLCNSEEQQFTGSVSTESKVSHSENIPTETSVELLDDLSNQNSKNVCIENRTDIVRTENQNPEHYGNDNSDKINNADPSPAQISAHSLDELSHQVFEEVEKTDEESAFRTVEGVDSVAGHSSQINSAETEITTVSNISKILDKDQQISECQSMIETRETDPQQKYMRQVYHEREHQEKLCEDASDEDNLREINNNDQTSETDNTGDNMSSSSTDKQDSTESNNHISSQTLDPAGSYEIKSIDEFSREVSREVEQSAVKTLKSAESAEAKPFNEMLKQDSEKENKNKKVDEIVPAENIESEINNTIEISKEDNNQYQVFVETNKSTSQHTVTGEKNVYDKTKLLSTDQPDSTELKSTHHISENLLNNTELSAELSEDKPPDELLRQVSQDTEETQRHNDDATEILAKSANDPLHEQMHQDSEDKRNNAELETTAPAQHILTKINKSVQNSKEDFNPTKSIVQSIPATTHDEHEVDQNQIGANEKYSIITDAQNATEVKNKDEISELEPDEVVTVAHSGEIISLETHSNYTSLENEVNEKVNSATCVEDLPKIHHIDQTSHKDTIMKPSSVTPEEQLMNNIYENESVIDNGESLSTDKSNSSEIDNTGQTSNKNSMETEIPADSSDAKIIEDQCESAEANVPNVNNSTETNDVQNSKKDSDQIQHSFESDQNEILAEANKVEPLEDLQHQVFGDTEKTFRKDTVESLPIKQHSIDKKDSLDAVNSDSNVVEKTDTHNENDLVQDEILAKSEEVEPLQHQISEDIEESKRKCAIGTESLSESTKVKSVEEVLLPASEVENNHEKVDASDTVERYPTEISNSDKISKVYSTNSQNSIQMIPTTINKDLSQAAFQGVINSSIKVDSTDQIQTIVNESKKPETFQDVSQISDKDQSETENRIEANKTHSLEIQLDQAIQGEEGPTAQSNGATPQNELSHQQSQDKENIIVATITADVIEISPTSIHFEDHEQISQNHSKSSKIIDRLDETESLDDDNDKANEQKLEKDDSLNQNNMTIDEQTNANSNLAKAVGEDGSNNISPNKELKTLDSFGENNNNAGEILVDESKGSESMRKEIGLENLQNEVQRTKRLISAVQTPEEKFQSTSVEKQEVIEEIESKKINDLNNDFSKDNNNQKYLTSQSVENSTDSEIHHEKDLEANKENHRVNSSNIDATLLKSKNQEQEMNTHIIDAEEASNVIRTETRETTLIKEVDSKHDTSTTSSKTEIIGSKKPFKNLNRIDNSENSNVINQNHELNNNNENFNNIKSTTELVAVKEQEQSVPGRNIVTFHGRNDIEFQTPEMVDNFKILNDNKNETDKEEINDKNATTEAIAKDLECEMLEQDDTKLKPRPENERTATYMYGVHKARQTSKTLRNTSTSYNIPLLENQIESLNSPGPKTEKKQSPKVPLSLETETKDSTHLASEESNVNALACEHSTEAINTNNSNANTRKNTLEKLELNLDLDTNNNDVKNEIDLETPTKLFDALNIFDSDEKLQNSTVEVSDNNLIERTNNTSPDLEIDIGDLNTHQLNSCDDGLEEVYSEHSRTSSSILKTIIELNESETPRKGECESTNDVEEDTSQTKKYEMINVLNEPYDPLEFGSGSDNDSEFTNSWTCSKETDENILSDEFLNEIYNETEPLHLKKPNIITEGSTPQGGFYEMNPYDNLPIDTANTTLTMKTISNMEHGSQGENDPKEPNDVGDTTSEMREEGLSETIKIKDVRNDFSKIVERESQNETIESNSLQDSDNLSQATVVHINSTADVETVTSPILNSTLYHEQIGILEPSKEKIFLKNEPSSDFKLGQKSSKNLCLDTACSEPKKLSEIIGNKFHVFESQSNINETTRESMDTTLAHEEIETLITPSQSVSTNDVPLVTRNKTESDIIKSALKPNTVTFDTEPIDTSILGKLSSDNNGDSKLILDNPLNTYTKDTKGTSTLLDKSATVIQTAYRKYNSTKNLPVTSEQIKKSQNLENQTGLSKTENTNDFSLAQNNAAKVIQNLFRNNYIKKHKSPNIEIPNVNNVGELVNIEQSPPSCVDIKPQENTFSLTQEEIEAPITLSQSLGEKEAPSVAPKETQSDILNSELSPNNIDTSIERKRSSDSKKDSKLTLGDSGNTHTKDTMGTTALLDKSATIIQTAYRKYTSKKNAPLASEKIIITQNLGNEPDLSKSESQNNFSTVQNNAARIIQKLFKNYYVKKHESPIIEVPKVNNVEEFVNTAESLPSCVEIKPQENLYFLAQEDIEALITPSQSVMKENKPPLVAQYETENNILKNELSPNNVNEDSEHINMSIERNHSSGSKGESNLTLDNSGNTHTKDTVESTTLLDKSAIIIQTAYRNYTSKKIAPLASDQLIKTQNVENESDLSKTQSLNDFSKVQNNAAKVIQKLFRNYYSKKQKSLTMGVPNANNIEKFIIIEESPPLYVEIMAQKELYTDADTSCELTYDAKHETNSSTIKELTTSTSGDNKKHKIEWFVGDEPIVRSIPDTSETLYIIDDAGASKHVALDDSLVDVASQYSNLNSPTASSEPATSPSINSIETIKVVSTSTSSLLEPDSISLSTISKLNHSDGTVSAGEMKKDNNLLEEEKESGAKILVTASDGCKMSDSINKEINEDTHTNKKQEEEETIDKHFEEVVTESVIDKEIIHNEKTQVPLPQAKSLSLDEKSEPLSPDQVITEQRNNCDEHRNDAEASSHVGKMTESSEALQLATEFLDSRTYDETKLHNSNTNFLDLERAYWESDIPYRYLEKPCIKKCASLKDIENAAVLLDTNTDETTPSDKSNESEQDVVDSLEASTEKLRKTDEIIEKMQQKYAAESRVNSVDERLSVEGSFEEPIIKSMKELQETQPNAVDDDEIVVLKPFQREDTRESSEQSDSVIFGSEDNTYNDKDTDLGKASLRRLYTIPGDDANVLFKTVTIDGTVKYIEPPESETTGTSDSNSFCLDEDTSENIRQKMMAYSLSEADSDFLGAETRDDSESMEKSSMSRDDFNITTALKDLDGTSTETESTIVSAATKIQAGARGFLTRRRLRRASVGTKTSIPENSTASFGNAAIDESLERLIEEEAAKKIQTAYRKYFRQGRNSLNEKNAHEDVTNYGKSEEAACNETEGNTFSSFESALAARRHKLQRGDAMHNDSAPDEENSVSHDSDRTTKSTAVKAEEKNSLSKETSGAAAVHAGKKINKELKWIALRQNSMPVQIESEVFRVIPKHMRKRIKSAGGENKRRMRILKD